MAEAVEQIHISLFDSTVVHEVLALHDLCAHAQAGATYLKTPVLGSVVPVAQGSLTVLVSGTKAGFDRAEPVMSQLATHLFHLDLPGLATRMMLVNNLVLAGIMAQIAMATAFAEAAGLDRATALDILTAGAGQSMVLNAKRANLESGGSRPISPTA